MTSLTVESLRRIESICSRFEDQAVDGSVPIEPFLGEVDDSERSTLLSELIAIDVEYRLRRGENPKVEDYVDLAKSCSAAVTISSIAELIHDASRPEGDQPTSDRYDFIEKVGTGGNGDVWRVYDHVSQRTLAIKLLRSGPHGDRAADVRLEREALVTGKLQHPGIPPIYDRGRLSDGTPYFSMKLIGGKTFEQIIHDCGEHDRIERCLGIFEQLAQTVAYAHSQAVIHRDLKPQNIMVGAFGEVQVMDWGLAKRIGTNHSPPARTEDVEANVIRQDVISFSSQSLAETRRVSDDDSWEQISRSLTVAGDVMGTPAYMSPEQARGEIESLDRRTDVFTLGAILFEILTGARLHTTTSVAEAMGRTANGEFDDVVERLEAIDDYAELRRLCVDCLQFDPDLRPTDANIVADAITDHLVSAERRARQADIQRREASLRTTEDRRRRRLQTQAAIVVALVSCTGAAVAVWQWRQASIANARAVDALTLADERLAQAQTVVDEFLTEVADQGGLLATAPGAQPVRRKLLEKARDYYEGFLREAGEDREMQLEVAKAYARLGDIALIIDPAGEDLMNHRNKVIAICDRVLSASPDDPEYLSVRASSYRAIGKAHYFAKRFELARDAYEESKQGFERLVDLRGTEQDQFELTKAFWDLGNVDYHLRRLDESESMLAESLARLQASSRDLSNDVASVRLLRSIHRTIGIVHGWGRGNWKSCSESFEQSLVLSKRAAELQPDQFSFMDDVATDEMNLAMSYNHVGNHEQAEKGFRECIKIREKLVAENPTVADYRRALAQVYGNFSTYSWWRKQPDVSAQLSKKSYQTYDELVADQPTVDSFRASAEEAEYDYISMRLYVDQQEGMDQAAAFARAEPEIKRLVARLAGYADQQPDVPGHRISMAYYACFLSDQPPETLLRWTNHVDADPNKIGRRKENWVATRALAYIRNDRHDQAVELFRSYPNELKRTQSLLVRCLASIPGDREAAAQMLEETEKKWNRRKDPYFDVYMLRAEAHARLGHSSAAAD